MHLVREWGEGQPILTERGLIAKMKSIEIFKPGTFTAMNGQQVTFSAADLQAIAAAYDPALHEAPLVVGHPTTDAPAYGWTSKVEFLDGGLVVTPSQVEPQFDAMVKEGRFKKRSASFFAPTAPGNPTPGKYYLRHVGFLGAMAPAVKGLKEVSFASGADDVVLEFGDATDQLWRLSGLTRGFANIARGFREFLIAEKGQKVADSFVANWPIDDMIAQSERFADEARDKRDDFSESPTEAELKTQADIDAATADLTRRETELAAREADVKARDVQFSEAARATARKDNETLLDGLIAAGKFAPGLKTSTLEFMSALDGVQTFEFAEGTATVKKTPAAFFAELLGKTGTIIDFSERAPGTGETNEQTVSFAAPADSTVDADGLKLHNKALDYQRQHPNTDYMAAVRAVGGR